MNSIELSKFRLVPIVTIRFIVGLIVGLILVAIYAHLQVLSADNVTGFLALFDHIFAFVLSVFLSAFVLSVGCAALKWLRVSFAGPAEAIAFSIFIGTGIYGSTLLGLGLLGLLRPLPVVGASALLLVLSISGWPNLHRLIADGIRSATSTPQAKIITTVFLCLIVLMALRAATPPHSYDEAIYHLPVTSEFVKQGGIFPLFDNCMGNQPFLIHMIYAVCLMAQSDIAAKLFSLALSVATALSLYAFSKRFLSQRIGAIALFTFFAAGMVVEISVTSRVDVSLAGMLFLSTYGMINFLHSGKLSWLWTSAMLAGFSLSIKHSAGIWLLMVGGMYLFERLKRKRERPAMVLKDGLAYVLIAFALVSPWYIKNYVWFGNPFYPFFTGEVVEFGPTGLRYFGASDEKKLNHFFELVQHDAPGIVQEKETALANAIEARLQRHPMLPWEFFINPRTYLMAETLHYPNYLFLLVPISLFTKRNRWLIWLFILSSGYFMIVTWTSWIARFLLPIYPPLTLIASYTLSSLADTFSGKLGFARRLPVYVLAAFVIATVLACTIAIRKTNSIDYLVGTLSRRDFMYSFSYYPPLDFINRHLPNEARVMSVGAQMTYDMQRDSVSDETWYTTKWRRLLIRNGSFEQVNKDLKAQGITHILYSPDLFTFAANLGLQDGQAVPAKPGRLAAVVFNSDTSSTQDESQSEKSRVTGPEFALLRTWSTFTSYQTNFLETVYSDENGYRIYKIR